MLAHKTSDFGLFAENSIDFFIISIGSVPVSAILPANTDNIAGVDLSKTSTTPLNWFSVNIAVILQTIPFDERYQANLNDVAVCQ